jgi:hypothetical protein
MTNNRKKEYVRILRKSHFNDGSTLSRRTFPETALPGDDDRKVVMPVKPVMALDAGNSAALVGDEADGGCGPPPGAEETEPRRSAEAAGAPAVASPFANALPGGAGTAKPSSDGECCSCPPVPASRRGLRAGVAMFRARWEGRLRPSRKAPAE